MRWLPDSLFGRLFLALCLPIAIVLALSYLLVIYDRQVLAQQLGGGVATVERIVVLTPELTGLDMAERSAQMSQLNAVPIADQPRRPRPARAMDSADARTRSSARMLTRVNNTYVKPLQAELGADCRVVATRAAPWATDFVDLARPPVGSDEFSLDEEPGEFFDLGGEQRGEQRGARRAGGPPRGGPPPGGRREWVGRDLYDLAVSCARNAPLLFRVPAPAEAPSIDRSLLWELALLVAALGVTLFVAIRILTRPLARLQQAAEAVGRSAVPPTLEVSGAREIRDSLQAFNTMQDRLRRYLDSRTRVLAAMSHDLRTPLTRLRLRAEALEDADKRQRLINDIEEMDSLVSRSLGLFRGLNDDEEAVTTDVGELAGELQVEFEELGHAIALSGDAGPPLKVRPQALKRALRNLLENALKYGTVAELSMATGEALCISVLDRGPGIPDDQLEKVFEPFNRLESSRSRDTGGVGLGLTIARDIAEMHGGSLVLRNRAGGGLEAVLKIPRQ